MKNIRCLLIDDEPDATEVLKLMLASFPSIEIAGSAESADEGVQLIQLLKPDLVFLDVEMPEKDGFQLLSAFPDASFKVVFVTAYNQYALNAIKHAALDYLLKPVESEELKTTIERVKKRLQVQDGRLEQLSMNLKHPQALKHIIIPSKNGFKTLDISEIVAIESGSGNYAFFFMADGAEFVCTKTLGYYDDLLSSSGFHRIHRSHMVNLRHIESFESKKDSVVMSNQRVFPIASRRKSEFRKCFLDFMSA